MYQLKRSRKCAIDFAIDFIYNQSHQELIADPNIGRVFQVGLFSAYVLPVNRFHYLLGMGYYVKNQINPDGNFYHRFGFRYHMNDRFGFNLTIKSHWGKADYFEYGIIYQFN